MTQRVVLGFPRAARLLKANDFSAIFRYRPCKKSKYFTAYKRHSQQPARLGIVVGKKFVPRAVTRNTLKRLIREAFRSHKEQLKGWDILIRVHSKIDRKMFPSACSKIFKHELAKEIHLLFADVLAQIR